MELKAEIKSDNGQNNCYTCTKQSGPNVQCTLKTVEVPTSKLLVCSWKITFIGLNMAHLPINLTYPLFHEQVGSSWSEMPHAQTPLLRQTFQWQSPKLML